MISYDPLLQRRLRSTPPHRFCPRRRRARHVEPHPGAINGSVGAVAKPMAVVPAVALTAMKRAGFVGSAAGLVTATVRKTATRATTAG